MLSLTLSLFLAFSLLPSSLASPVEQPLPLDNPINPGFPYGSSKVRGVNLGGWLVLEPWITPRLPVVLPQSLFDNTGNANIVDEWTFGQSAPNAQSVLNNHWNTWITESDFAAIAAAGLNHVRLPIGYWAWDISAGEPYKQGQLAYLAKAVTWAGNHGLHLIIDLHGAPGSQNGFDNSGHKVSYPQWQSSSSNIQRTDAIIKKIASQYGSNPNVVSVIAPLNEPAGFDGDSVLTPLKQFYYDSYGNVRFPFGSSQQSNTLLLIHDAFMPLSYWNGYMTPTDHQGVAMDTHIYQMFSQSGVSMSNSAHIQSACSHASDLTSFDLWVIVGEWTPAMTDCAKYLNGRGVGARYDGSYPGSSYVGSCTGLTGKASSFSSSYKTFLRQTWEAQVQTFEKAQGWIQWDWKNENADEWSYQAGLANGWIPSNPTSYQYPNICG